MNCYNCMLSEILNSPKHYPKGGYSIFGYCHKNNGNYPIYVPGGKCKDLKTINKPPIATEQTNKKSQTKLSNEYEQLSMFM